MSSIRPANRAWWCADDPTWWGDTHSQLLAGSRAAAVLRGYRLAIQQLVAWRDRLFELHAQLGGSVPPDCDFRWALSQPALLWARSTVWSRGLNAFINGSKTVVLAPVCLHNAAGNHRVRDLQLC